MKTDIKSETTVEAKRDTEPKMVPLFARFVQAPKVRTGIRSGVRNLV